MAATLSLASFPRAILHLDADAFFASCEQARDPKLKGKVVITGKERGIASAVSYEGKALGIKRGMSIPDIKRICPDAVHLPSDYETYSLYSARMFSIVRDYTNLVEEYSIDECFAELTGLRRPRRISYPAMAAAIKQDLEVKLGMTFSMGLGPTKVIAKMASKWQKPSGFDGDLRPGVTGLPAPIASGRRVGNREANHELPDSVWDSDSPGVCSERRSLDQTASALQTLSRNLEGTAGGSGVAVGAGTQDRLQVGEQDEDVHPALE